MEIMSYLKPTENPSKLKEFIENIFPHAEVEYDEGKGLLRGEAPFEDFWRKIRERGSEEVLLEEMKKNKVGNETRIKLSKVCAGEGKVSLYAGSAIGSVELIISWSSVKEIS